MTQNLEQAITEAKASRTYQTTYFVGRETARFALLSLCILGLWKLSELMGVL